MRILVTGANGFVGTGLVKSLRDSGHDVIPAVRRPTNTEGERVIGEIDSATNWREVLERVDVVVHLAARVHVMKNEPETAEAEFRRINTEGTLNLARQAAEAGVKRFVFLSTIKVNGESTTGKKPFSSEDAPAPSDSYSRSKWEAEKGLVEISQRDGLEVVIVRPPLVYGPGVKANFLSLVHWIQRGVPLPLGAINNRRSLVYLGNLIALIKTCVDHPKAANQIFLVSDDEDLSTTELIRRLAKAMNRSVCLIPVPSQMMELGFLLIGKRNFSRRILGNLRVDIKKTKEMLGWVPPYKVNEGLATAEKKDPI
jgi:nucleoside-diphosphate-sugar epimerase